MTASDFDRARALMVDGQLRPSKVTDRRVLDAMRTLPRERFLPPGCADLAYIDADVKLGRGRVLMKPLVQARLIQLAAPRRGEAALVVGSGCGYGAALLAACGVHVTALEEDPDLAALATAALDANPASGALDANPASGALDANPASGRLDATRIMSGFNITFVTGSLTDGWAAAAPYDLIMIEGAVRSIPETVGRQVAAHGRLVTIVIPEDGAGTAVLAEPSTGSLSARPMFDATTALLPSLLPRPTFVF